VKDLERDEEEDKGGEVSLPLLLPNTEGIRLATELDHLLTPLEPCCCGCP
jgi:hypothetical protein